MVNQSTINNPITPQITSNIIRTSDNKVENSQILSENPGQPQISNAPLNNTENPTLNPVINSNIVSTTIADTPLINEPNINQIDASKNQNNITGDIEE